MKQDIISTLAPAAPPTTVTGMYIAGLPLSEVVLLLNAIYIIVGIAYALYKWRKDINGRK